LIEINQADSLPELQASRFDVLLFMLGDRIYQIDVPVPHKVGSKTLCFCNDEIT
jgi:hypothetical protein